MSIALRAVLGFFALKLTGLAVNVAVFPVLGSGGGVDPRPKVSLLVPARNERTRLGGTLPSFAAQDADELIVLDDCSTDDTAAVAESLLAESSHARVVAGSPAPPGWVGKTWACHQLSQLATGDVLMFCDADVLVGPGAVDAVLAQLRAQSAGLLSVFARQQTETLGEHLLVPLIDDVLLCFLPFPLLSADVPSAATASGAVFAFTREAYDAMGGFAAVRAEIVDDVAAARRARRCGLRLGLALGGDLVRVRMYTGYRGVIGGLGRGLLPVSGGSRLALSAFAAWHLLAYTAPVVLWRRDRRWALALLAAVVERAAVEVKTGRRQWWQATLSPLSAVAAIPVFAQAMRRTQDWRGRVYPQ